MSSESSFIAQQRSWSLLASPAWTLPIRQGGVTLLGNRESYSLRAVPCLGAFGELWEGWNGVLNQVNANWRMWRRRWNGREFSTSRSSLKSRTEDVDRVPDLVDVLRYGLKVLPPSRGFGDSARGRVAVPYRGHIPPRISEVPSYTTSYGLGL